MIHIFLTLNTAGAQAPACQTEAGAEAEYLRLASIIESIHLKRFKSWDKLQAYYECFKHKDSTLSSKDKAAIMMAAKAFNIPFQLLFCMMVAESRFVTDAGSSAGAVGIAQFMPITVNYVKSSVLQPQKKTYDHCAKNFKKFSSKGKAYCGSIINRQKDYEDFSGLVTELKTKGLLQGEFEFNREDRLSSIVMGAFLLHNLLQRVNNYFKENQTDAYSINMDSMKLALAAYNGGMSAVSKALAATEINKAKALVEVRKIAETRGHMDNIEHCMTAGDGHAPSPAERKKKVICQESM